MAGLSDENKSTAFGWLNPLNWISAIGTAKYNKKALEQGDDNLQMQKEQMEYTKQLNEEIMKREDTAYQRQVNDLRKAGLSPLMTENGGAGSGGVLTPYETPQNTTDYNALGTNFNTTIEQFQQHKFQQQELDIRNKDSNANVDKTNAETEGILIDNLTKEEEHLAMLEQIKTKTNEIREQISEVKARIENMKKEHALNVAKHTEDRKNNDKMRQQIEQQLMEQQLGLEMQRLNYEFAQRKGGKDEQEYRQRRQDLVRKYVQMGLYTASDIVKSLVPWGGGGTNPIGFSMN